MHYTFGQYSFRPDSGELNDGQKTVQLRPQVAKLLDLLLRNADNTVSREDIRNHLWGSHVVVEFEEGISACVRQLRIALNDGASGTRYIQTISRRGYKFVFPVTRWKAAVPPKRHYTTWPRVAIPAPDKPPPAGRDGHKAAYYSVAVLLAAALIVGSRCSSTATTVSSPKRVRIHVSWWRCCPSATSPRIRTAGYSALPLERGDQPARAHRA